MASFGAGAANFAGHTFSSTVDFAIKAADSGPYQPTAPPLNVPNPYPCEGGFYTAGGVTAGIAGLFIDPEADIPEGGGVVIGKLADLSADGAIGPGERTLLDQLPDQGSEAVNWTQNEAVLLKEMASRQPIRDASVNTKTGALESNTGFLARERDVLAENGWEYDPQTHLWSPGGRG